MVLADKHSVVLVRLITNPHISLKAEARPDYSSPSCASSVQSTPATLVCSSCTETVILTWIFEEVWRRSGYMRIAPCSFASQRQNSLTAFNSQPNYSLAAKSFKLVAADRDQDRDHEIRPPQLCLRASRGSRPSRLHLGRANCSR